MTTSDRPITPGSTDSTVTPGDSVRPVNTGQEAQLEETNQGLDQSEFSVLNSPGRPGQLEQYVHKQPGDEPNLQIEQLSENFQVDQDLAISDSPDIGSDDSTERLRTHLQDSGNRSSGTGHTVNPLGPGHTGNRSDRKKIQSADLDRLGLMLGSMVQIQLDIVLMSLVLLGEIVILFPSITLIQVNILQLR